MPDRHNSDGTGPVEHSGTDQEPDRAGPADSSDTSRQSLGLALVGGLIGAIIGAVLWGLVGAWIGRRAFWMAIAVGLSVGYGVRTFGRGNEPVFGGIAALFAALGCLGGTVLMFCDRAVELTGDSTFEILKALPGLFGYLKFLETGFQALDGENRLVYALVCDAAALVLAFVLAFVRIPKRI